MYDQRRQVENIFAAGVSPLIKLDSKPINQLCDSPYEDENDWSSNQRQEEIPDVEDECQINSESGGVNEIMQSSRILQGHR